MTEHSVDFGERNEVKELADRIKLLIPGMDDLGKYKEQGALALAQAALTSGLNPFLGEIWIIRQGRTGEPCTGFSIKPGIKGARRAARNQAAAWGLIPPYYRPLFRVPTDWERKLMKAAADAAAVACDLELMLPVDHPWYKNAGGERYTVTGLGVAGGGGRMSPFQQARKRAEEDALKLAFDLPIYGESDDIPEAETEPQRQPATPDPVTPVIGDTPNLRLVPAPVQEIDFSNCGANFWNNLTRDLQQQGLIPGRAWLLQRFRDMGVTRVTEDNAQDLVKRALEGYANPEIEEIEENGADLGPETPQESVNAGGNQVDAQTGEILGPARPLSPSGVVMLVQDKLRELAGRWPSNIKPTTAVWEIYEDAVLHLCGDDEEEEAELVWYLLFKRDSNSLTRAEVGAFLAWCLEEIPRDGAYHLNEWAQEEARCILDDLAQRKEEALEAQVAYGTKEAERTAQIEQIKAEQEVNPEDLEDPPTIQELEAQAETNMLLFEAETEQIIAAAEAEPGAQEENGVEGVEHGPKV